MGARRFGICLRVFNLIAPWWTQGTITSEIWCWTDFQRLSEDFGRFPKSFPRAKQTFANLFWKISKTSEEEPMMFRSYSFVRDYVTMAMVIFSLVKITCYFHTRRYHVYARKLTWYFTGVHTISKLWQYPKHLHGRRDRRLVLRWASINNHCVLCTVKPKLKETKNIQQRTLSSFIAIPLYCLYCS